MNALTEAAKAAFLYPPETPASQPNPLFNILNAASGETAGAQAVSDIVNTLWSSPSTQQSADQAILDTIAAIMPQKPPSPNAPALPRPQKQEPVANPGLTFSEVASAWVWGTALSSFSIKDREIKFRDPDGVPIHHSAENWFLDLVGTGIQKIEEKFDIDLKADDFSIASPDTIAKNSNAIVRRLHAAIPEDLHAKSPGQLNHHINQKTREMQARAWLSRDGVNETWTESELSLAYFLSTLPTTEWMPLINDAIYESASDFAATIIEGGRLVSKLDTIRGKLAMASQEWPLAKEWLVQEPFALKTIRNDDEKRMYSRTLWGMAFNSLQMLPIVSGQLLSDFTPIPWTGIYAANESWRHDPNAIVLRPGTPTAADYVREKIPFLSPALATQSPAWMSGTIMMLNGQTGQPLGVIGTLQPNEVIESLTKVSSTFRAVNGLIARGQKAIEGTSGTPWKTGLPRPQKVIEAALAIRAKNGDVGIAEASRVKAQVDQTARTQRGVLHTLESYQAPIQAAANREDHLATQLYTKQQRLNEIFSTGVRTLQSQYPDPSSPPPQHEIDRLISTRKAIQDTEKQRKLLTMIRSARQSGIVTGYGTDIGKVIINDPIVDEIIQLKEQLHPTQYR